MRASPDQCLIKLTALWTKMYGFSINKTCIYNKNKNQMKRKSAIWGLANILVSSIIHITKALKTLSLSKSKTATQQWNRYSICHFNIMHYKRLSFLSTGLSVCILNGCILNLSQSYAFFHNQSLINNNFPLLPFILLK